MNVLQARKRVKLFLVGRWLGLLFPRWRRSGLKNTAEKIRGHVKGIYLLFPSEKVEMPTCGKRGRSSHLDGAWSTAHCLPGEPARGQPGKLDQGIDPLHDHAGNHEKAEWMQTTAVLNMQISLQTCPASPSSVYAGSLCGKCCFSWLPESLENDLLQARQTLNQRSPGRGISLSSE